MRSWVERADLVVVGVISLFSSVLVILDFFGIAEKIAIFGTWDYSKAALLLLGALGLHVVLSNLRGRSFEENFPFAIEKVIRSLEGVSIVTFADAAEQEEYIARRISEAKKEVCDLSWKTRIGRGFALGKRANSHEKMEKSIATASKRIMYREIFVFSDPRRVEKALRRIEENRAGYSCRYFKSLDKIPRLQFVIIDGDEVIFASSSYPKLCAISHPYLSATFQSYFDEAWSVGEILKEGSAINQKSIETIRGFKFENE